MKEFMNKLMAYIIIITVTYAIISFLALECSPLEWNWALRAVFTVLILAGLSVFEDNNHNRYT